MLIRNAWVYRKLIALAFVLGLLLWFIWINDTPVVVLFPFGLGSLDSTSGIVMLLGALVGSLATALGFGLWWTLHRARNRPRDRVEPAPPAKPARLDELDDLPPPDYGARTSEGFPDARWSAR